MSLPRRFHASLLLSILVAGSVLLAGCDEGPSGPTHFSILSPGESRVTVLPGQTVQFRVQLNATGFRVEYLVDGEESFDGPDFDFRPTLVEHTVRVSIIPESSTAAPEVREYLVGVEVPGNTPPAVSSFGHTPAIAEAVRDTFTFSLVASDSDGGLSRVVLDFGDGSTPRVLTGGLDGGQILQEYVFPAQGTYVVRATIFDDDDVGVATRDTVEALPPNQLPTGTLTVVGEVEGDEPLTVSLQPSGNDVDGQVVQWELDRDLGGGFEPIQPNQVVQVAYPYREDPYRPRLRLTDDDGDSTVIQADEEILVFRQISVSESDVSWQGNPQLSGGGRLFILADGQDELTITVTVRGPTGAPLDDVPVRITSLRGSLAAPDGTQLGSAERMLPQAIVQSGANGQAIARLTSNVSTRLEAVPEVRSTPFDVLVEASRGHETWVELSHVTGVETETTVSLGGGSIIVTRSGGGGYCAGDLVDIRIHAENRSGGPARGKYAEIRYAQFVNQVWFGARPGPGYGDWRTDNNGDIVFSYRPAADDDDRVIAAWVDGNRLSDTGAFNFRAGC